MKILVTGASGFFGRNVAEVLSAHHDVYKGTRDQETPQSQNEVYIDLLQPDTIEAALNVVQPDAIVNCAGVVDNNETAAQNPIFTDNLLQQVVTTGLKLGRIIILGSAAEYGVIDPSELPVAEDTPARPTSPYGISKAKEVAIALKYRQDLGLPIVIARPFNPIGTGMPERQIISRILARIEEIREGKVSTIEVSRLDAVRDYIDVRDAAAAIDKLLTADVKYSQYNIGLGESTSNGELLRLLLQYSKLSPLPEIVETSPNPEPTVASLADITRLQELGWRPTRSVEEAIKEIVDAANEQ